MSGLASAAAGETVIIVVIIFPDVVRSRRTAASTAIFTYSFQGSLLLQISGSKVVLERQRRLLKL